VSRRSRFCARVPLGTLGRSGIAIEVRSPNPHGLVSSHGFVDGNKRTGWVAASLFLLDHCYRLSFDPFDTVRTIECLATSQISKADLARWFRVRLVD